MLFELFDEAFQSAGFFAMGGQIAGATIMAAPKQRNTEEEKRTIKDGGIPEEWKAKTARLAQKDPEARWTVKYSNAKPREDGERRADLAIPAFRYKNHSASIKSSLLRATANARPSIAAALAPGKLKTLSLEMSSLSIV